MLANAFAMSTVPAEDIERAVNFYKDVLGLKLIEEPSEGTALFEAAGGSQIFIYMRGRSTAEHTAITFLVEDIETTVKSLTDNSVTFEQYDLGDTSTNEQGIAEMDGPKMAWLTDPEGNILGLLSR